MDPDLVECRLKAAGRAIEHVYGAGVGNSAHILERHANGQVVEVVAVEVADGYGMAELVEVFGDAAYVA